MSFKKILHELQDLGFKRPMIAKHTGISIHKLKLCNDGRYARFTYPEVEAFNHYYDKCKELEKVYGDKLAEYLEKGI